MLARIHAVSAAALESGALKPIATDLTLLPASPKVPCFQLSVLRHKPVPKPTPPPPPPPPSDTPKPTEKPKKFNPFLPFDPQLHVQPLAPAHHLLLNKFPVVSGHTLVVTARFESQADLLTAADWQATLDAMAAHRALAFFNSGPLAGASQQHKHVQLLPLPIAMPGRGDGATEQPAFPFADALRFSPESTDADLCPFEQLPFLHAAAAFDTPRQGEASDAAAAAMEVYLSLLRILDPHIPAAVRAPASTASGPFDETAPECSHPFPYNLLLAEGVMLLVPRRAECAANGVSVNALGFAGCLLLRTREAAAELPSAAHAMQALCDVTFARPQSSRDS